MKKTQSTVLRKKVTLYIAMAMLFLGGLIILATAFVQNYRASVVAKGFAKQINLEIEYVIDHSVHEYNYRLHHLLKHENLAELIKNRDREALYKLLEGRWKLMVTEEPNLNIMHFHLADGSSFLRMHAPDKFGDDLVSVRPMLKEIHKSHKNLHGYETGKFATSYRIMSPVFDKDGEYLGAFEIGLNPRFILEAVNKINKFCGLLFIKEDSLTLFSQVGEIIIDGYRIQSNLTPQLQKICVGLEVKDKLEDAMPIEANGRTYKTHLFNLDDYKLEPKVKLMFFQDVSDFGLFRAYLLWGLFGLMLFVLFSLVWLVYRRIGMYEADFSKVYKDAQEELKFKQNYLQATFDVIPHIMITTDGEVIDKANPAMLHFFDYENIESFKNKHHCICDFFIENGEYIGAEVNGIHWLEYILSNQDKLHKVCMKKGDRESHFIVRADSLIIDTKQRSVVIFNDVTELEELDERLKIAVNGTNDGLWDWNIVTNEIYFSPRWKEMLGYEDFELENRLETWEELVHPDDKPRAEKDFQDNMDGKTETYENVHRLRHKNGSWIWVLDRGQTKFDENAKAVRMVGFHTDITKQKELESQLIENEKLYYDFFEHTKSANIMYSTDDNGATFKIKALNYLVEELEDVKREEILGKRVDEVFVGIEDFGLLEIFKEVYLSGESQKMPISLYDDGELKGWRENYIFKLSNGDIVASYEDRTQEKKLDLLLTNTLNSVNNLIFVKDNNFKYIECNSAFEEFLNLSREEILGKSDYELFEKDIADFFRTKDEEMLAIKEMKYNYEWVTYPDESKRYLLTIKSPLRDEQGHILGLVGNSIDMTGHKKLEDKLKSSQEQFEQFMEFIPANIIIKENGTIVYANTNANDFFHLNSIVGKTVEVLLSQEKAQEIEKFEKQVYKNGFHEEIIEIVKPNKEVGIYRNMAFVINDKVDEKLGIVSIDITNEYNANREIARVLSAFDRSDISILITDLSGSIGYVNPSWCKTTGYSKEELIGQNPRIVKSGDSSPQEYAKMWKELTSGRVWTSEVKNRAKDGSEFWEDSTIMPSFDSEGVIDGYIAFKLDITDKMHLREELKNQEELMISQSRHAAMGEMISMIAHQWRQPISVIAMDANNILVDIELDNVETQPLKNDVIDIIEQTKHLSQTIDDFRNFFKPNKIKDEVLVQDVYIEAYKVINKSLENNNIGVVNSFDSNTVISIYSRELLQVIINILKNAKEALEENREKNREILSTVSENNDTIVITICDNAGGVDEDIQEHIFEPYFSTKHEKNGTGLGLYMSKIIIEKHLNGTLRHSNRGDGSCFIIELPKKGSSDE